MVNFILYYIILFYINYIFNYLIKKNGDTFSIYEVYSPAVVNNWLFTNFISKK